MARPVTKTWLAPSGFAALIMNDGLQGIRADASFKSRSRLGVHRIRHRTAGKRGQLDGFIEVTGDFLIIEFLNIARLVFICRSGER